MILTQHNGWWVAKTKDRSEGAVAKAAGFMWAGPEGKFCGLPWAWCTKKAECAARLSDYAETPAIKDAVLAASKVHADAIASSKATDSEIAIPCPAGLAFLPYQKAGIAFAASRPASLIADEMGLGKTIQAIGVMNSDPAIRTVLVICPATLKLNWRNEILRWSTRPTTVFMLNGVPVPAAGDGVLVVIANYEQVRMAEKKATILAREWDLLIVDEAHRVKNPKAQQTAAVCGTPATWAKDAAGGWIQKTPRIDGIVDRARRRVFLTGTPILNRPAEIFTILQALDPANWRSRRSFEVRYCDGRTESRGGHTFWTADGATRLDELRDRLRTTIMVRRLKKDVLTDLPAKTRSIVVLPANGAQGDIDEETRIWTGHEDALQAAEDALTLAHAAGDQDAYTKAAGALSRAATIAFTEISRVRHAIALKKAEAAIEWIQEVIDQGQKVVIFAHHHDVIAKVAEALADAKPAIVTGEIPVAARQPEVDRFQNDPACRAFIGSIAAAGVGLTLTAAHTVAFVELDWTPANVTQAEDRCHRIGQKDAVSVYHLVLDGSLDQRFVEVLIHKQRIADEALDKVAIEPTLPAIPARERRPRPSKFPAYSEATKGKVITALRMIAGVCDGAAKRDGCGFSKVDVDFGHTLASLPALTDGQCHYGLRLCRKYRRQIDGILDAEIASIPAGE